MRIQIGREIEEHDQRYILACRGRDAVAGQVRVALAVGVSDGPVVKPVSGIPHEKIPAGRVRDLSRDRQGDGFFGRHD